MCDLSAIPSPIRSAALRIIDSQSVVPRSPLARSNNGSVQLCLAAALVVAAADNEDQRGALINRFGAEGRAAVIEAFGELGWGKDLGLRALTTNDTFDETERKEAVLKLLTA